MENFSKRELFLTIIMCCVDKRTNIDEKLLHGCYNAIIPKFFENDTTGFLKTLETVEAIKSSIDQEKLIANASNIFTEEEKKFCYDMCEDILHTEMSYDDEDDMINFVVGLAISFDQDIDAQDERQELFRVYKKDILYEFYISTKYKYSLKLPKGWIIQEDFNETIKLFARRSHLRTIDMFIENITVSTEYVSSMTLNDYVNISKNKMGEMFKEFNLWKEEEFEFKNGKGRMLEYSVEQPIVGELRNKSFILLKNNTVYLISANAHDETSIQYNHLFDEVAESFVLM